MKKFKIFYEFFVNDPDRTGLDVIRLNEKGSRSSHFLENFDTARGSFGSLHHIEEIVVSSRERIGAALGFLPVVSFDDKLLLLGEQAEVVDGAFGSAFKQIMVHSVSFLGYQVFLPSL